MTAGNTSPAESGSAELSREVVSNRLLKGSVKRSYIPVVDIDWEAPLDDDKFFVAPKTLSLYGTELWHRMDRAQRIELSRQEFVNMLSTAIWFENIVNQGLLRHVMHADPRSSETHYSLTELGDETRHMVMFGKAIQKVGAEHVRVPLAQRVVLNTIPFFLRGSGLWLFALLGEDITDELQRQMVDDPDVQPLAQRVLRVHILEEARHISFARDGIRKRVAEMPRWRRAVLANVLGFHGIVNQQAFINPVVYRRVGLPDPKAARRAAKANENFRLVQKRCFAGLAEFFEETGLMGRVSRKIWKKIGYLD
ncbi:AurF N-oxygenase family protein [Streptomyces sp. S465]|uniref:AurF N-oxygenase family protein n=1 Tax=Streptomyces sp. S465 TaxID=2979468 RepID=UPI0022A8BE4C|nr:diiron oxygenase [Streptomyces sp. S465]WAP60214.1 diiron oxygenase [Streptomyces sp. S465]